MSHVKFLAKFHYLNFWQIFQLCNFDFVLFWLGIWYESIVWVIMGWQGVFSERRHPSCTSFVLYLRLCFVRIVHMLNAYWASAYFNHWSEASTEKRHNSLHKQWSYASSISVVPRNLVTSDFDKVAGTAIYYLQYHYVYLNFKELLGK